MSDRTASEFNLCPDIKLILQIKAEGQPAPLKIFITYLNEDNINSITVYPHFKNKDPVKSDPH